MMSRVSVTGRALLKEINRRVARLCAERAAVKLMEVCGTHTMAISSSGIRRAVDQRLKLVSGPGCPVCVTSEEEIEQAVSLARVPGLTVLTFGDMMRVPSALGSLSDIRGRGGDVRVVYSPLDALALAAAEPAREFVFLGVGFETTAPTVAATVLAAARRRIKNFSVLPMFKLIPPALKMIARAPAIKIDGFILPGHVSTIIGAEPYRFLPERFGLPCCITGFEALDILSGILIILQQMEAGPAVAIQYRRSVRPEGNRTAQALIARVFKRVDAEWRGLGKIKGSGSTFRARFSRFDARQRFGLPVPTKAKKGTGSACRCGEVMLGVIVPSDCPLFARTCCPDRPVGPCMVSSEGACAAYYRYER